MFPNATTNKELRGIKILKQLLFFETKGDSVFKVSGHVFL